MKKAGCYAVAYGIESADQRILNQLQKNITPEQVEEAVRLTKEQGIESIGYFILGSPGDTTETIRKTIDFAKKLRLDYAQFAITTPYPGTKLYQLYLDCGYTGNWDQFIYHDGPGSPIAPVFESDGLDRAALHKWAGIAVRGHSVPPLPS